MKVHTTLWTEEVSSVSLLDVPLFYTEVYWSGYFPGPRALPVLVQSQWDLSVSKGCRILGKKEKRLSQSTVVKD